MTSLLIFARAFHFASGMILVGVVAFRWLVLFPAFAGEKRDARQKFAPYLRRLEQLFIGSCIVLFLSGVAWFWAVAAEMSDTSLVEALDRETLAIVLFQTQFGVVSQWRLGFIVVLGIILFLAWRQKTLFRATPSLLEISAGFIATLLLVSIAGMGHAAAGGGPGFPWKIGADMLHLFAVAIWPTGLLPFVLFLLVSRKVSDSLTLSAVLAVVRRFSAVSFAAVGLVIFTGIINTWFLVGNFTALVMTDYGRILCLKLSLLLLVLGIATWNRCHLLPLLFARADKADQGGISLLLRRLQIFVTTELALAVAIIVIVSFLGITPLPR